MMTSDAVCRLVNEWGTASRVAAGEQDAPYPAASTAAADGYPTDVLIDVADSLHPVFAAATPDERVRLLDALVQDADVTVRVSYDRGQVVEDWVPRDGEDALLVAALTTIRAMLGERGVDAIGVCDGSDCVDVWIERSRGRPRRYCSTTCSGRARAAAHRRRHREETA